jgi:hypothetical protein
LYCRIGHPQVLVFQPGAGSGAHRIRGLVSLMQVERQLGMQLPSTRIAGNFAQIGNALS